MSTNSNSGSVGQMDPVLRESDENLTATAEDSAFHLFEFDRDHGSEVDGARRELAAQWEVLPSAA